MAWNYPAYRGNTAGAVSASITSITGSTSPQAALPGDPTRSNVVFYNGTDQGVYLAYGESINLSTQYTLYLPSGSSPYTMDQPIFAGPIYCQWRTSPSTGSLMITHMY